VEVVAMMNLLIWIYLVNSVFLINHEIDSAYWKEWKLFKMRGGIDGFLAIHFVLLLLILLGLVLLVQEHFYGLVMSLVLCGSGFFAFFIHIYYIRKGREEFNTPMSLFILGATLVISIIQIIVTAYILLA
jgi:hypothetical protein